MQLTRRDFIRHTALTAGWACVPLAESTAADVSPTRYDALRRSLRAYYTIGKPNSPEVKSGYLAIVGGLEKYAAANPGYDALDLRRESYRLMRENFTPVLFSECPFYFETGTNGGWSGWTPAQKVEKLCRHFYTSQGLIPPEAVKMNDERRNNRLYMICGPLSDLTHHIPAFHTVFTKGFGGVRAEVAEALATCPADDPHGRKELEAALDGLDTIHALQLAFAEKARAELAKPGLGEEARRNYARIAEAASRCPWEPPRTFFEGLNALWFIREIPSYVDALFSFSLGHPDSWLIDFYRRDLAAGRLTKEEAVDLIAAFLIAGDCHYDSTSVVRYDTNDHELEMPLTLGGCDSAGNVVYNEITRLVLDLHLKLDLVYPKLHCRISATSPQAYLEQIGSMLMQSHAVFALFNDDRCIPQLVEMGYPPERARDYLCTGCWDPNVDSLTDSDTGNYMSVMRIFEMTIYREPELEKRLRVKIDPIDDLTSYEAVRDTIYRNFIRFFRDTLSEYTRYGRQNAKLFPHPAYSACLEGFLKTRRDTMEGGIFMRPTIVTLAFLANAVDSLCAIRKLCFEDKTCTLRQLLAAVRSNWSGKEGERLRAAVLEAPYWGDNSDSSNKLMRWFIDSVADDIEGFRNSFDGPYVLATWVYRQFNYWGKRMRATPDGRYDGDRLAQGFAPSEYRCKTGITTVFNAIGSLDHKRLFSSNANLTFDKAHMSPELFASVFRVTAKKDMHLLQPNCLSAEELLDAQAHPERHRNLIVKVCGFSARFVALSKPWQDEVIMRHRLK